MLAIGIMVLAASISDDLDSCTRVLAVGIMRAV